ncbi:hypothetical protein RJZ56_000273 [Blastomyces dermatitidis]|uniref:DUF1746 domain-containing protein n=1 Tax=Ajellomyces dermatitidis (strain ER-3 / ATCC MYA-2586) TaxID=559297 RepID=A0ABM9YHD1_AJEDR|nr:uncharacterized protein BDCG_03647 [Blastomyces dermatitidis ER-3]EEQ88527.1 hypothetical protein BDCG_03647 [Blastomyces dermatitidis ER-3]
MTTPDVFRDAQHIADVSNIPYDSRDDDGNPAHLGVSGWSQRRAIYASSKAVMLERLLRDLDMLIYCELSAVYYMDCSILHFTIRAIVQFIFFTPKAGPLPETSTNAPPIVTVFLSNIACMILHYVSSAPMAGEASRGYLHGGLFIDFIGQKGPISKFRLFLFDLLIFGIQLIMMCVILEKDRTKQLARPTDAANRTPNLQDHDSEERGVAPEDTHLPGSADDIEMQDLPSLERASAEESRTRLLEFEDERETSALVGDRHPRDAFISAQAVIADINIFQALRDQWNRAPQTNASRSTDSQPTISTQNGMVVPFLQRRFRFQLRTVS